MGGGVKELLIEGGSIVVFNAWENLGLIAKEIKNNNMEIKDVIRYKKSNPFPRNRDRRYVPDCELAIWCTTKKGKWTFNRQADNYQRPEFTYPIAKGYHPTQKPVPLMEDLLRIHSNEGDVVLDCFMGSGSTGVACVNTNRNFIGIEIDESYFSIAKERINKEIHTI